MILINGNKVKISRFPNNEIYIKEKDIKLDNMNPDDIILKYEEDNELIYLMYIKKYLESKNRKATLYIPYFPYSRMDRTEGVNLFTLKYITQFINSLNFDYVIIEEPHSDVVSALLDRVEIINRTKMITNKIMDKLNFGRNENTTDFILYPDAGALKRYNKQLQYNNIITCNKNRDFVTGEIKGVDISWNAEIGVGDLVRIIIVDDLCSKGGTLLQSAKEVTRVFPNSEIYLAVAHCENTIFEGELLKTDYIKKIYTTNSILSKTHEKIDIMEVY